MYLRKNIICLCIYIIKTADFNSNNLQCYCSDHSITATSQTVNATLANQRDSNTLKSKLASDF